MKETPRALKLKEAGILRHGSVEAWQKFQRESGMKARRDTPRGFQVMDKEQAREISKKGAAIRWSKNEG